MSVNPSCYFPPLITCFKKCNLENEYIFRLSETVIVFVQIVLSDLTFLLPFKFPISILGNLLCWQDKLFNSLTIKDLRSHCIYSHYLHIGFLKTETTDWLRSQCETLFDFFFLLNLLIVIDWPVDLCLSQLGLDLTVLWCIGCLCQATRSCGGWTPRTPWHTVQRPWPK